MNVEAVSNIKFSFFHLVSSNADANYHLPLPFPFLTLPFTPHPPPLRTITTITTTTTTTTTITTSSSFSSSSSSSFFSFYFTTTSFSSSSLHPPEVQCSIFSTYVKMPWCCCIAKYNKSVCHILLTLPVLTFITLLHFLKTYFKTILSNGIFMVHVITTVLFLHVIECVMCGRSQCYP